ncbi:hypothetical protein KC909_00465 [Candidatus Dojkabacteria bacterium]|uniref:Glycosyltransferase 2-like domain-containing protein n=1 Tax=Candidatus Dojkabacteria bacterium TaxID=2099670 RepID=A0A955L4Q7_9BACT|nr:hypothetical protein [Candidatus Dojkabacteria bacterium]
MANNKSTSDKFFEKIPPAFSWFLILFPFWGGFFVPQITAYIVIVFNVYFLYRSASFLVFFLIGYRQLRKSESIDWLNRLMEIDNIDKAINDIKQKMSAIESAVYTPQKDRKNRKTPPRFLQRIAFILERRKAKAFLNEEIERLEKIKSNGTNFDWKELHHVVMIPHWKEPMNVLRDTLENIKNSNYPTKKISIMLGAEARDPEGIEKSKQLQRDFSQHFENVWINSHELTENEIIGKSSNMASAGKTVKAEIEKLGWDMKKTIITSCDADSLLPQDYFANVSYFYVTLKDSTYKYFNSAIMFYANIWKLPFYARVKNSMSSIYNVSKLARQDKFVPFSTYSVSFWMIDQIGYWTPWVTPEDYHLFFKGLFHFPDKVSAVPVFQTIMSDAAEGDTHVDTIKNTYFQERRWSWGVSDDGWLIKQTIKLLLAGKLTIRAAYKVAHVLFDHIIGITMTIVIVIGGNIPLLINQQFAGTVLGDNLPRVSSYMIRLTVYFLIALIMIDSFLLRPKNPDAKKDTVIRKLFRALEWFVLPYAGFLLVILPGIEAHTRLLFGKYLEYYLTKKK